MQSFLHWLIVFAWAGVIFFLSSQPVIPIPAGLIGELVSKSAHFIEFFIFTFLLLRALKIHKKIKRPLLLAVLISLTYAASDEFHQLFVSGRSADVLDFFADSAGTFTLALIELVRQRP